MGMMETMVEALSGGHGATTAPLAQAMLGLFGSDATGGVGLGGLVAKLEQAGLGDVVHSWIGNGANRPIDPADLHAALGDEQVQHMATQAHMPVQDFIAKLAQHLPGVVDRMTPDGHLPQPA